MAKPSSALVCLVALFAGVVLAMAVSHAAFVAVASPPSAFQWRLSGAGSAQQAHSLRGSVAPESAAAVRTSAIAAALVVFSGVAVLAQQARSQGKGAHRLGLHRVVKAACKADLKEIDGIPSSERERALTVNLDPNYYGSFAEIGAGQEVSRWFLRAGAAAGTVARTVSAYDMAVSDRMYGTAKRYVTKERMMQMLKQEYAELEETLRSVKGEECRFFSFASTLAAKAYMSDRECEGWLGILYQKEVGQEPSTVYMHIRMCDPTAELQGDALGVLGTNLVYLCKDSARPAQTIVKHLLDDIGKGRLTINAVAFEGPGWPDVDPRLVALWLVQYNIAEAVVFEPQSDGSFQMGVPNVAFYKRPIVLQRGRFRFVSKTNEAIFDASVKKLSASAGDSARAPMPVIEMTLETLGDSSSAMCTQIPEEAEKDFKSRFNVCACLGIPILVSGLGPMNNIAQYIIRYTNQEVVIAVGGGDYSIERGIFRDSEADGLSGGLLEAFGKIFSKGLKMYAFPNIGSDGAVSDSTIAKSSDEARKTLLNHLVATAKIVPIEQEYIAAEVLDPNTNAPYRLEVTDVLNKICRLDSAWKDAVPSKVVAIVEERGLNQVLGALECDVDGTVPVAPLELMVRTFRESQK